MKKKPISRIISEKAAEFKKDMTKKLIALYFFIIAAVAFWALTRILYHFYSFDLGEWLRSTYYIYPTFKYIFDEIASQSFEGIFYLFMFSSLFFLPIPLEVLFSKLLLDGLDKNMLVTATFLGLLAGQHLNYFFGKFFGYLIRPYIKKKTRVWVRRKVKKYGMGALFVLNLLPLPYPIFNFAVGLFRYSYLKWVVTVSAALFIKLMFIAFIFNSAL